MSSAVVSTSAAMGRPFVFDAKADAEVRSLPSVNSREPGGVRESPIDRFQSALNHQPSRISPASVILASRLEIRPAPEMVSSGIPALDTMTGGLPRGCLTEICGPASSGRTTLLLAALAAATRRGEFCALVDASDALDSQSAVAAGVELDRLLWVRCGAFSPQRHRGTEKTFLEITSEKRDGSGNRKYLSPHGFSINNQKSAIKNSPNRQSAIGNRKFHDSGSEHCLEQVLRVTDLLLESGGFGLIVLDLADLPLQAVRRIPLTTWFRFRRAVEHTPTVLLAVEQQSIAGNCSSLRLQLRPPSELTVEGLAAQQRKNAAHSLPQASRGGASRGLGTGDEQAPEGRKRISLDGDSRFAEPTHTQLLTGLDIAAELIRSCWERKPVRSTAAFASKTAWAG